jgi:hypothetical protein
MARDSLAVMRFARKLAQAKSMQQQESAERAFNKLTRTFAVQLEALKRYRSGAELKLTVQNVSVSDGGQAVVGNVLQQQSRDNRRQPVNPTLAVPDAGQRPMAILNGLKGEVIPLKRARPDDEQSFA